MSSICHECGKKLTCCKCGKLLCTPNGTHKNQNDASKTKTSCRIIGYYKVVETKICADCYK